MSSDRLSRHVTALISATIILAIEVVVLWVVRDKLGVTEDTTVLVLLVLPLIVYLGFTGRLKELKLGPLEARLAEDVGAGRGFQVLDEASVGSVQSEIQTVMKEGVEVLPEKLRSMEVAKPPVLALVLGRQYSREHIADYLRDLAFLPGFKFVVIQKANGETLGYAPHYNLTPIIKLEQRAEGFLRLIAENRDRELARYPGIRTTFLSPRSTYRSALRLMLDEQIESLLILDSSRKVTGVVERDQLMGQLLLAISE